MTITPSQPLSLPQQLNTLNFNPEKLGLGPRPEENRSFGAASFNNGKAETSKNGTELRGAAGRALGTQLTWLPPLTKHNCGDFRRIASLLIAGADIY